MLRAEAGAFDIAKLDDSQRVAAGQILDAIQEAQKSLTARPVVSGPMGAPFRLHAERRSNVLFLSGSRGTGKSTLMLALMRAFVEPEKKHDEKKDDEKKDDEKKAAEKKAAETKAADIARLRNRIGALRGNVVWLETLDLEPLARPSNLLAAILARIERRAAESLMPNGADRYDFDHELLSAIGQLTNDVALAWDGNVEQRAAHLDPEMYAAEVRQAEHARLGFNDRLNDILDELAKEIGKRKGDDPIFLLPVDDLDLNPMRTLDLLRLLRMAHSPRLLTLALGNLALVDTVLAAKHFGEFTEPFRHATGTSVWPVSQEEIAQTARQTTAHALRKLLPPGQRIELGPMTIKEALAFKPREEAKTLGDLMREIPFSPNKNIVFSESGSPWAKITNLAEFLGVETAENPNYFYSATKILETAPRRVADLYAVISNLQQLVADASANLPLKITDFAAKTFRDAIDEDDALPVSARQSLQESIVKEADGSWMLAVNELQYAIKTSPRFEIFIRGNFPGRIRPSSFRSHAFVSNKKLTAANINQLAPELDSWSSATYIFLHDFLVTGKNEFGNLTGNPFFGQINLSEINWSFISQNQTIKWNLGCVDGFDQDQAARETHDR